MKTYVYNCILIFSVLNIILTGCVNGKTKKSAEDNDIRFDSVSVDRVYHLYDNPDNPACTLQIKFVYPVQYANNEVLETIQQQFVSAYFGEHFDSLLPTEAVNNYTEEYLRNYRSLEDDFKEEAEKDDGAPIGSWFSYYETSSNEITYNRNDLLAYSIHLESYTGGAHGAHSVINHVLNLTNGEKLEENDIFIENFQEPLAEILVDKIAKANDVKDPKELENIGFFSIEEIYPNGNFLVDDKGITYDFNEYEIAAYVVGVTNVFLPYKEIRHLLQDDSPVSNLFED